MKERATGLAGFVLFFGALWLLWDTPVVYPLRLFVVLLHEVSHGLAALATGGEIREIAVTPEEGGWCDCPGGSAFVTLSAGYLGSLGFGALLIVAAGGRAGATRWTLVLAGAVVAGFGALFARSLFTLVFTILFGAALLLAGTRLARGARELALVTLGATSCLYALLDVKSDVLDRPEAASDARALAELTGIPTLAWGLLWIGISVTVCWWLLGWAWRRG